MSNDYQTLLNWLAQNPNFQNGGSTDQVQNFLQKVGSAYNDFKQQVQGSTSVNSIDPNAAQTGYQPSNLPPTMPTPTVPSTQPQTIPYTPTTVPSTPTPTVPVPTVPTPNGFPSGVPSGGPISAPSATPQNQWQSGCFRPGQQQQMPPTAFTPGSWGGWDTPGSSGLTPYQQPTWMGGGQQPGLSPYDTQVTGFVVRDQNSAWGAFAAQPVAANSYGPVPYQQNSLFQGNQLNQLNPFGSQDSITANQPDNGRYSTTMRGVSWVSQPDRTLNTATINGCRNAAIADDQTTQWTFDSTSNVCALKYGQPVTVIKQGNLTSGTVYRLQ
jgi:hypothetical protein